MKIKKIEQKGTNENLNDKYTSCNEQQNKLQIIRLYNKMQRVFRTT